MNNDYFIGVDFAMDHDYTIKSYYININGIPHLLEYIII